VVIMTKGSQISLSSAINAISVGNVSGRHAHQWAQ
jgi:hypothetical protein